MPRHRTQPRSQRQSADRAIQQQIIAYFRETKDPILAASIPTLESKYADKDQFFTQACLALERSVSAANKSSLPMTVCVYGIFSALLLLVGVPVTLARFSFIEEDTVSRLGYGGLVATGGFMMAAVASYLYQDVRKDRQTDHICNLLIQLKQPVPATRTVPARSLEEKNKRNSQPDAQGHPDSGESKILLGQQRRQQQSPSWKKWFDSLSIVQRLRSPRDSVKTESAHSAAPVPVPIPPSVDHQPLKQKEKRPLTRQKKYPLDSKQPDQLITPHPAPSRVTTPVTSPMPEEPPLTVDHPTTPLPATQSMEPVCPQSEAQDLQRELKIQIEKLQEEKTKLEQQLKIAEEQKARQDQAAEVLQREKDHLVELVLKERQASAQIAKKYVALERERKDMQLEKDQLVKLVRKERRSSAHMNQGYRERKASYHYMLSLVESLNREVLYLKTQWSRLIPVSTVPAPVPPVSYVYTLNTESPSASPLPGSLPPSLPLLPPSHSSSSTSQNLMILLPKPRYQHATKTGKKSSLRHENGQPNSTLTS
jgi:hypothetical protein